jgi:hypothetical protein
MSVLRITKGAIDGIARHAEPTRGFADVVAGFCIGGQNMRALNLMQSGLELVVA